MGIPSRQRARDHPQAPTITKILHIRRCLQVMEAGSRGCPISTGPYDYPLGRGGDGHKPKLIKPSPPTALLLVSAQGVHILITLKGGGRYHMQHLPRLAPHLPECLPQKDMPLQPFPWCHHLPPWRVAQRSQQHDMRPQAPPPLTTLTVRWCAWPRKTMSTYGGCIKPLGLPSGSPPTGSSIPTSHPMMGPPSSLLLISHANWCSWT